MISPRVLSTPCPTPSAHHETAARARQITLTKPAGSLGRLEHVAITLAALQETERPRAETVPVLLFAADHGITAEGVSPYPSAVTEAMMANFVAGGAAAAVMARCERVALDVIDVGTLSTAPIAGVILDKMRLGTRNFAHEPAMTTAELDHALEAGARAVLRRADGADLVILGEMGIGNTTSAAAIAAALLGCPAHEVAGAGTGLDPSGVARKAEVIARALALHGLSRPCAPSSVLQCVGGFEIAALVGAIVTAASRRVPVLIDGFIVAVAAMVAVKANAAVRPWLIFAHRSAERGARRVLDALDATPLLDLDLRLGEASGALAALPLIRLACALHNDMATFAEAAVPGIAQ